MTVAFPLLDSHSARVSLDVLRHLLALIFTATAVFGQPPCCCASVKASRSPAKQFASSPAKPAQRSCCTPAASNTAPAESAPAHPPGDCPCKKPLPDADAARVDAGLQLGVEWAAATPAPWCSPSRLSHASPESAIPLRRAARDCPTLTTDDLLYAHHRLRC